MERPKLEVQRDLGGVEQREGSCLSLGTYYMIIMKYHQY